MKVFKYIGIGLLVLVVLILIIALFLPSARVIEEARVMKAPPEIIFDQVNTMPNWAKWSPFTEGDPGMVLSFEGPEAGVGATQKWESPESGKGMLVITQSIPFELVAYDLDFYEQGKATGHTLIEKVEEGTKVTWGIDMIGMSYPVERIAGLFYPGNMKPVFARGLEKLDSLTMSLKLEKPAGKTGEIIEETIVPLSSISIRDICPSNAIGEKLAELFGELAAYVQESGAQFAGPPFAVYFSYEPDGNTELGAGIPVDIKIPDKGRIKFGESPSGKVISAIHYGPYETVGITYDTIIKYVQEKGLEMAGPMWEIYIDDPEQVEDISKLRTKACFPVK